jgi:hypothetical protein
MPIPTPEDDRIAKIVEAGATALAERDGVVCFRPGCDTADDQQIRDSYRREARLVIEATRAAVEAPLRAELEGIGNLAYRFGHPGDSTAVQEVLTEIQTRAKRATGGE